MTEANCNLYMEKIAEIEAITQNPNTTLSQITTLMNELETIENNIDAEVDTMPLPSTTTHLYKFVLVATDRSRKADIQKHILNLIDVRIANLNSYTILNTYEQTLNYVSETNQIKNYVDNFINNCDCMKTRSLLIKKLSK